MAEELIVLVDGKGKPIGTAPKLASHHANTPLHLAFSCYIFNSAGQFLLTKRAHTKKVWPGVWTNSVCGHPAPDEPLEAAIKRRSEYELGLTHLTDLVVILPDYRYRTPLFNGIIENEICPVYFAKTAQEPRPNPDEVGAWRWVDWADLSSLIQNDPAAYSYWTKDQLKLLTSHSVVKKFING